MLNVADAILNKTQAYEDPQAQAVYEALMAAGVDAVEARRRTEALMPTATEKGHAFEPAAKEHAKGPPKTAPVPGTNDTGGDNGAGHYFPNDELQRTARDFMDAQNREGRFNKALAGSAVNAGGTRKAFDSARAITGEDIPSTPGNAQTALDKFLRAAGPMPSPAQLSALGMTRDDAQRQRDLKYTAIRARDGAKPKSAEPGRATAVVNEGGNLVRKTSVGGGPMTSSPLGEDEARQILGRRDPEARKRLLMQSRAEG